MTPVLPFLGAALAGAAALGALLLVSGVLRAGRIDLGSRIAPYLDRPVQGSTLLGPAGRGPSQRSGPARSVAAAADRMLGGADSVRARLQRAGRAVDVEGFRLEQVLWATCAGVLAAALGTSLWWTRGASPAAVAVVVLSAAMGGALLRDHTLSRAARTRESRIMAEFPAVAELLALAVTAGEGTTAALDRVTRLSRGELATELAWCLAQARTGASMPEALRGLGDRTGLPALTRFVDGLVIAIERGTPLGEVLRAQAQDAREASRQQLIEEGGKREIAMMIPVVFLVLPVTVLFAVFPGLSLLRISL